MTIPILPAAPRVAMYVDDVMNVEWQNYFRDISSVVGSETTNWGPQVTALEGDVVTLEGDVTSLESDMASLEEELGSQPYIAPTPIVNATFPDDTMPMDMYNITWVVTSLYDRDWIIP